MGYDDWKTHDPGDDFPREGWTDAETAHSDLCRERDVVIVCEWCKRDRPVGAPLVHMDNGEVYAVCDAACDDAMVTSMDPTQVAARWRAEVLSDALGTFRTGFSVVVDTVEHAKRFEGSRALAINTAVDALNARRGPASWSYWADELGEQIDVTEGDLARLGAALLSGYSLAESYSAWCVS